MKRRRILGLLALAGVRLYGAPPVAHAQVSADQVLSDVHLSAADRQRVLGGEFVTADVPSASERDLSFAIAFLVITDQVTGFGGSMKRSLGSSIMAKKMREIFDAGPQEGQLVAKSRSRSGRRRADRSRPAPLPPTPWRPGT